MGRLTTVDDPKRCETCKHFIEEEGDCERYPREPGDPPCIDIWTCIGWEDPLCSVCRKLQTNIAAAHGLGWRQTKARCQECQANIWEEIL
jgi:hypothetical protein